MAGEVLTGAIGFGGATVGEDMGLPPLARRTTALMLSVLHQCELLAVMDNRVRGDGLWGLIECAVPIVGEKSRLRSKPPSLDWPGSKSEIAC